MLEIRNLVKHFGPLVAVDDVSFNVSQGEVLGFLGPNGAGKSTTMKMITGFLSPSAGTAIVCGYDILERPIEAKKRIGYLPEGAPAYPDMTPAEFLEFIARIRGFSGPELRRHIGRVVERIRIAEVLHQPIETLSKGFRRRVGVAQALLHDPAVLILDEPTDGLDPNQKYEMREIIAEMQPEKAIVISTHLLEEVDAVCSRAIIIARGRLLADRTPGELAALSRYHNAVRLGIPFGTESRIRPQLEALPGVAGVEEARDGEGSALMIFPSGTQPVVAEVAQLARDQGWKVTGLRVERGRLDDVFRDITAEEIEAAPQPEPEPEPSPLAA
ncbi:MAG: ATP-binding cassette domain-containing protein [Alphaproteobacteria bacterium]|nr:ATP-binding cassette domain-containing protein [Alphaproteobacteria bacterium]